MDRTVLPPDVRLTRLYERYERALHAYCLRRMSGEDAADAVAAVFTVAWRRIHEIPPEPMELPWLYGVARRVVSEQRRSMGRWRRLGERLSGIRWPTVTSPDHVVVQRAEYDLVWEALWALAEQDREVLLLSAWEELPNPQIAQVLGCSTDAAAQRLHRAKRRLGAQFRSRQGVPDTGTSGSELL